MAGHPKPGPCIFGLEFRITPSGMRISRGARLAKPMSALGHARRRTRFAKPGTGLALRRPLDSINPSTLQLRPAPPASSLIRREERGMSEDQTRMQIRH